MMGTVSICETSIYFYKITRRSIPEVCSLQSQYLFLSSFRECSGTRQKTPFPCKFMMTQIPLTFQDEHHKEWKFVIKFVSVAAYQRLCLQQTADYNKLTVGGHANRVSVNHRRTMFDIATQCTRVKDFLYVTTHTTRRLICLSQCALCHVERMVKPQTSLQRSGVQHDREGGGGRGLSLLK
jgi:hypothetical protein